MTVAARQQRRTAARLLTAQPSRLPAGWPAQLTCPQCECTAPTTAFLIGARPPRYAAHLVAVATCPRAGCTHSFAPLPSYFGVARAGQAVAPGEGDLHA